MNLKKTVVQSGETMTQGNDTRRELILQMTVSSSLLIPVQIPSAEAEIVLCKRELIVPADSIDLASYGIGGKQFANKACQSARAVSCIVGRDTLRHGEVIS